MLFSTPALSASIWYGVAPNRYPTLAPSGDATGRDAAYSALGSDGWCQYGPGLGDLAFGTIPSGVSVIRQSYKGTDFAGTPLRWLTRTTDTETFRADSSGIAVTGKAVVADSARVGSSSTAAPLVVGGGVTAYGASTFHRAVTLNANPSFGSAVNNLAFQASGGITISNTGALSMGGSNNGTTLVVGSTGTGDMTLNGHAVFSDSARVGAAGGSAPLVVAGNLTTYGTGTAFVGGATFGGGDKLTKILSTSSSLDFNLTTGCDEKSFALTGAALSDVVVVGVPDAAITGTDITWSAWVSSANVVTLRLCSRAGTPNPPSGTYRVWVLK